MRILILAAAMIMMLGIGMAAGSLLTGRAHAVDPVAAATQAKPVVNTVVDGAPVGTNPVYLTPGPYTQYSVPPRLQVIVVPAPDGTGAVTLLLDNQTGETYVLRQERTTPSGFRWTFLTRI